MRASFTNRIERPFFLFLFEKKTRGIKCGIISPSRMTMNEPRVVRHARIDTRFFNPHRHRDDHATREGYDRSRHPRTHSIRRVKLIHEAPGRTHTRTHTYTRFHRSKRNFIDLPDYSARNRHGLCENSNTCVNSTTEDDATHLKYIGKETNVSPKLPSPVLGLCDRRRRAASRLQKFANASRIQIL